MVKIKAHRTSDKMNQGKIFETAIKKSAPDYVLLYRIPDAAQSFGGDSNLRFSLKNPFDFLLWDSLSHILYALELKSVSGKSVSFERVKEEHGVIHWHQINGLNKWNEYDGIIAGFLIEFRDMGKTIFLPIFSFNQLCTVITKKSFNIKDLDDNHILYITVPQFKKRTRYLYDVDYLLKSIDKEWAKGNFEYGKF